MVKLKCVLKDRLGLSCFLGPLCLSLWAEVVENKEEECDTDLERQNVEELYDYVRNLHQTESQEERYEVQHKALIPVLRPYQKQAVNWMLRREKYKNNSPKGMVLKAGWV